MQTLDITKTVPGGEVAKRQSHIDRIATNAVMIVQHESYAANGQTYKLQTIYGLKSELSGLYVARLAVDGCIMLFYFTKNNDTNINLSADKLGLVHILCKLQVAYMTDTKYLSLLKICYLQICIIVPL